MKLTIRSCVTDMRTRLKVLLSLIPSGRPDTMTEASNLKDELGGKKEIKTEQKYRNALDSIYNV